MYTVINTQCDEADKTTIFFTTDLVDLIDTFLFKIIIGNATSKYEQCIIIQTTYSQSFEIDGSQQFSSHYCTQVRTEQKKVPIMNYGVIWLRYRFNTIIIPLDKNYKMGELSCHDCIKNYCYAPLLHNGISTTTK